MQNKKNTLLCFILYKTMLDLLFCKGTAVHFIYLNRILDFNITKYIVGWIIYLLIIHLIMKINNNSLRFIIKILFMLSGVANISVYGLRNYSNIHFLIVLCFWFLLIFLCVIASKFREFRGCEKKKIENISSNHVNTIFFILSILITIYCIGKFGINVSSFSNLYMAREVFRSQHLSTIDSYLMSWNATVILPWLFLIAIDNKKYIRACIVLLFALLMFSMNGMKTWLLLYAIIIALVFLTKRFNSDDSINIVLFGLSLITLVSVILYIKTGDYNLVALIDRSIILPGETNYYYLDFFSEHEYLYLRESIFKVFGKSPYNPISSIQIAKINMANAYYQNATNGLIGDIYGNFGFLGILTYPFMILTCLILLDKSTNKYNTTIRVVVMFILMWMLVNTSFFTWIMTGGFLLYIIILNVNKRLVLIFKK